MHPASDALGGQHDEDGIPEYPRIARESLPLTLYFSVFLVQAMTVFRMG